MTTIVPSTTHQLVMSRRGLLVLLAGAAAAACSPS